MITQQQLRSILVVDDEQSMRMVVSDTLRDAGYRVRAVPDGVLALQVLRAQPTAFGLILLDLMMPNMNGWQFYKEQQADPTIAHIPVILLSAGSRLSAYGRPPGIAADAFLSKPWNTDELLDTVARYWSG